MFDSVLSWKNHAQRKRALKVTFINKIIETVCDLSISVLLNTISFFKINKKKASKVIFIKKIKRDHLRPLNKCFVKHYLFFNINKVKDTLQSISEKLILSHLFWLIFADNL